MPKYTWKLKNKEYCTGCPILSVVYSQFSIIDDYRCKAGYYDISLERNSRKKRPVACIRDLGE